MTEPATAPPKDPLAVSIVMPLFNKEGTIRRALHSVLAQTVTAFELIVVDDGSTDSGAAIASTFTDPRIRILHQENRGVASARNLGVAHAAADLIAFLDADDQWEPDFLATILSLRDAWPSCAIYATSYWIRFPDHARPATLTRLPPGFVKGLLSDYFLVAAHSDPPVCSSAAAVTKHALAAIGGFPHGVSSGEDLLTWARLAAQNTVAYCAIPKSHFWAPVSMSDRPGRVPQVLDPVGAELRRLLTAAPSLRTQGLPEYLSLWHRMRGVLYLQLGQNESARRELRKAFRYAPSLRPCALLVVAMIPPTLSVRILATLHRIMRALAP